MEARPPIRFRKLRVAWSVAWGVMAVLLIALWVRSYWWRDMLDARNPDIGSTYVASINGKLRISLFREHRRSPVDFSRWGANTAPAEKMTASLEQSPMPMRVDVLGFELVNYWNPFALAIPCWFLVPVAFAIAVLPWFRLRFRLRTLLIAMTLFATFLGFVAYLTRN